MLVEVPLQLLVGNVDAQLLEGIHVKVFKPEDVEDADLEVSLHARRPASDDVTIVEVVRTSV